MSSAHADLLRRNRSTVLRLAGQHGLSDLRVTKTGRLLVDLAEFDAAVEDALELAVDAFLTVSSNTWATPKIWTRGPPTTGTAMLQSIIRAMRDKLAHQMLQDIDMAIVWRTARINGPELGRRASRMLKGG